MFLNFTKFLPLSASKSLTMTVSSEFGILIDTILLFSTDISGFITIFSVDPISVATVATFVVVSIFCNKPDIFHLKELKLIV